jgi:hypothetical protein
MDRDQSSSTASRSWLLIVSAVILLLILLMFRDVIGSGKVLFATDDNVGMNVLMKSYLPDAFLGFWNDTPLLGMKDDMSLIVRHVARWCLSAVAFSNWIHACYLAGASLLLLLFFRNRGLRPESALIGTLTAFWLASNFTLIYPGHLGKFGNLLFAAAFLWCISQAVKSRQAGLWAMLAGGAMGNMFGEQPDVALFFASVLGPYALFLVWQKSGWNAKAGARIILPFMLMAALFAIPPVWLGYKMSVRGVASMDKESPTAKWNFCTQWSWPPEESIDFIAPGYMGWRSGEPAGPYWGRMGRSPGWETTHQGFQNFKLENQYLGAIPLVLALFAVLMAVMGMKGYEREYGSNGVRECRGKGVSGDENPAIRPHADTSICPCATKSMRAEIIFWGCAAAVTLLLSFGKYFPLYYLFYQLPVVSSIRNPNKFLAVFQLAMAILAAYGFELTIKHCFANAAEQKGEEKPVSRAEAQRRRSEDDGNI